MREDNIIVVRGRHHGGVMRQAATDLLKTSQDDSPLKTVLTYGLAAGLAYYGGKMLLGSVEKTVAQRTYERAEQNATINPNSAAGLGAQLADAFGVRGGKSMSMNVDESTVFDIFLVKKLIQTKEFFGEVAQQYAILSKGRRLLDDLRNGLDSWAEPWQPDWNRLRPTIDKILSTSRARVVKKTTLKGLGQPDPLLLNAGR